MKKTVLCALAVFLLFCFALPSHAADDSFGPPPVPAESQLKPGDSPAGVSDDDLSGYPPGEEPEGSVPLKQPAINCSLSEPVVSSDFGHTKYTTTLTINTISEFYGYQIEIVAEDENAVTITDKANGVVTPAVYKDGKLYLAVMVSGGLSGDIEICEITGRYPFADTDQNLTLVIDKLKIVTSIIGEQIVTLGPPALTLALPHQNPPLYVNILFYILLLFLLLAGGAGFYFRKEIARFLRSKRIKSPGETFEKSEMQTAETL
ncbi:MAG: hypothetical protein FWF88_05770 [Peptococcaceae bacterium]|nr:hypothetical protein [Peptococcaceae bacterium]